MSAAVFSNSRNHFAFHPTMSQTTLNVSLIPDDTFFDFMCEINALPVRKQAKWHGFLRDTNGMKRKVHFIDRQLVIKDQSTWITLKPSGDEHLASEVEFASASVEEQHRRLRRAYERGGLVAEKQEHDRLVDEAATGNHRSKPHKIRVPTRPGEPVRS
jgi:hypothetical protein